MAKIMVVDDAEDLVDSIAIYLEKEGHQVTKIYSGEEVLRLAPVERPDVIVLDVNLPGLDGFEVARRLKSHVLTAGIPVIFLTVRTSLKDRVQGLSLGALEYITNLFPEQHTPYQYSPLPPEPISSPTVYDEILSPRDKREFQPEESERK